MADLQDLQRRVRAHPNLSVLARDAGVSLDTVVRIRDGETGGLMRTVTAIENSLDKLCEALRRRPAADDSAQPVEVVEGGAPGSD